MADASSTAVRASRATRRSIGWVMSSSRVAIGLAVYRDFLTPPPPARYRWPVVNPELLVRGAAIVIGLLFGAIGTTAMLASLGVFGDGRMSIETSWVGVVAGLAFVFGGLAVIVGYGVAGGTGLEDDVAMGTGRRVRVVQYLLALGVTVSLAMIATWAAFGSGAPRVASQIGSVALWLFVGVLAITGVRRLIRRR
jgi:hypothetical protein